MGDGTYHNLIGTDLTRVEGLLAHAQDQESICGPRTPALVPCGLGPLEIDCNSVGACEPTEEDAVHEV
jgi:hypothetical protein